MGWLISGTPSRDPSDSLASSSTGSQSHPISRRNTADLATESRNTVLSMSSMPIRAHCAPWPVKTKSIRGAWVPETRAAFSPTVDSARSCSRSSAALSAIKVAFHEQPDLATARVCARFARYSGLDAAGPMSSRCSVSASRWRSRPA